MHVEENKRGERELRVTDPNGYHFVFVVPVQRSPEALRAAYAGLSDELAAALAGLTAADLDLQVDSPDCSLSCAERLSVSDAS